MDDKINLIKSKLDGLNYDIGDVNGSISIITNPENVIEIASILKKDFQLSYNMCVDIFAIDRYSKENRYEVVINLYSIEFKHRIFLKVLINMKDPEMPSMTSVWKSAEWYERETFDMHGIKFIGNPDLRRIYMPEEYEHYPLRKDFPLMGIEGSINLPKK